MRTTSRHCPASGPWVMRPSRSRVPTTRNPAAVCRAMLAAFSGKMPDCTVQAPPAAAESSSASSSARPTPRPCAAGSTYTECSITPAYTHRSDTAEAATQPRTSPTSSTATNRCSRTLPALKASQVGGADSKVACPVAMPAA